MDLLGVDDKAKVRANNSSGKAWQLASYDAAPPPDHDFRNGFELIMGARSRRVLPSQHACTAVGQLSFGKATFNLLVTHCQQEGLGVLPNELPACTRLLMAVCDVLQAMNGRNQFQLVRIPQRFQECMSTSEHRNKHQARNKLSGDAIGPFASALQCAVDTAAFAQSTPQWAGFIQDVNELRAVLLL